jgi:hypothetical protein
MSGKIDHIIAYILKIFNKIIRSKAEKESDKNNEIIDNINAFDDKRVRNNQSNKK